jgi:hypothetical protein
LRERSDASQMALSMLQQPQSRKEYSLADDMLMRFGVLQAVYWCL